MVADTLYHSRRSGISYTEPLTGNSADKYLSACRSIAGNISDDDILPCLKSGFFRRIDNNLTSGKPLSEIIIRITDKL